MSFAISEQCTSGSCVLEPYNLNLRPHRFVVLNFRISANQGYFVSASKLSGHNGNFNVASSSASIGLKTNHHHRKTHGFVRFVLLCQSAGG